MSYTPSFSLLTKVLDARHLVILQDWLEFVTLRPADLIVYMPDDGNIYRQLDGLAHSAQIAWKPLIGDKSDDLRNNETEILRRMVEQSTSDYLLSVNLDTIPFRTGLSEERWLDEVFELLRTGDFPFLTGCGVRYLADTVAVPGRFLRTRYFSNNFGLILRDFWLNAIERHGPSHVDEAARRFHSEWAVEEELRRLDRDGLRRLDSEYWRVFHVQQWDDRLLKTRELFRRGVGVKRYLNRIHEHYRHPWEYYFNYPKPPLITLLRIRFGELRRGIGWPSIVRSRARRAPH